jgi:hypothetical protein
MDSSGMRHIGEAIDLVIKVVIGMVLALIGLVGVLGYLLWQHW